MKKIFYIVTVLFAIVCGGLTSCDDYESYADQRDYELSAISKFVENPHLGEIKGKKINVISEDEFLKDTITDLSKNEFVRFSNGVYMQIVRRGCGNMLKESEHATMLCRLKEYNLNATADTARLVVWNDDPLEDQRYYEKVNVIKKSGSFSLAFCPKENNTYGAMYNTYYSYCIQRGYEPDVPAGWKVPLSYIKLGRPAKESDEIAKVRLIVPHDEGHMYANYNVIAMYYEITFERGI